MKSEGGSEKIAVFSAPPILFDIGTRVTLLRDSFIRISLKKSLKVTQNLIDTVSFELLIKNLRKR